MTENEYESWFDKYLGDIESLDSSKAVESPFANTPKPLKRLKWIIACSSAIIVCVGTSCWLTYTYELSGYWLWNWLGNALINLSIGIIASLILMIYTNIRERNIFFYSDLIPVLEKRYIDMREAYFDTVFKIRIGFQQKDYEKSYQAWHANSNACFVIIEFLRYLYKALPYRPACFYFTPEKLDKAENELLDTNNIVQTEYFSHNTIDSETIDQCIRATDYAIYFILKVVAYYLTINWDKKLYIKCSWNLNHFVSV